MMAIVLAGGAGTRLQGVLPHLPKVLAPIRNKPFFDFFIEKWMEKGVTHFFFSTGHLHQVLNDYLERSHLSDKVTLIQEPKPLGTGGGLNFTLNKIGNTLLTPFLIMNGDTFFDIDLDTLIRDHHNSGSKLTMVLKKVTDTKRYGVVALDQNNKIVSFNGTENSTLVYGGISICSDSTLLKWYEESVSLEHAIIPALIEKGNHIHGHVSDASFIDIGTPESLAEAQISLGGTSHERK